MPGVIKRFEGTDMVILRYLEFVVLDQYFLDDLGYVHLCFKVETTLRNLCFRNSFLPFP